MDEALFTTPLYTPSPEPYNLPVGSHDIPLMVFPYIGSLKTLIYSPFIRSISPGPLPFRLPMILAGALTIFLFFRATAATLGTEVAMFAAALLATDASLLMTNTFDWGPVALEHLLLVAGCLLYLRGRPGWASFLFGLALWNKAVFVWALGGLLAAGFVLWIRLPRIERSVQPSLLAKCLVAFLLGASPLLIYSLNNPTAVVRMVRPPDFRTALAQNSIQFQSALEGSAVFGYITGEDFDANPQTVSGLSAKLHDIFGERRKGFLALALVLSVLFIPLAWKRYANVILATLAFLIVSAFSMLWTGGGGSAHHMVLLWPAPHLLVAAALGSLKPIFLRRGLLVILVGANLLVVNEYVYKLQRDGSRGSFSDAVYPLAQEIRALQSKPVCVVDWGLTENLIYLTQGQHNLRTFWPQLASPDPIPPDHEIAQLLHDPEVAWVTHVESQEAFHGVGARLDSLTDREKVVQIVYDANHRPVFEIRHYVTPGQGSPMPSNLRNE